MSQETNKKQETGDGKGDEELEKAFETDFILKVSLAQMDDEVQKMDKQQDPDQFERWNSTSLQLSTAILRLYKWRNPHSISSHYLTRKLQRFLTWYDGHFDMKTCLLKALKGQNIAPPEYWVPKGEKSPVEVMRGVVNE
jgi:hypothetical protein